MGINICFIYIYICIYIYIYIYDYVLYMKYWCILNAAICVNISLMKQCYLLVS